MNSEYKSAYNKALNWLAKREFSSLELNHKLIASEFNADTINIVLDKLAKENLQNDFRFTQMFIITRVNQGKGSLLITQQLQQKGITNIDLSEYDFYELAQQVREKKYGKQLPTSLKEKSQQQRFLQSRGFSFVQINSCF